MSGLLPTSLFLPGYEATVFCINSVPSVERSIIFLHGWGLSPRSYAPYLEALAKRCQADIYAPALPGFGGTEALSHAPEDEHHLLEFLAQALQELAPAPPPVLIGHSLGAALAARLAATTDLSLDPHLILISPAGVHHEGRKRGVRDALSMAFDLRHEIPHQPLERLRDAGPSFLRHPRAMLQTGWAAAHIDIRADLAALNARSIRTTIITADQDSVTPHEQVLTLPGVRTEVVHGTHGWLLSSPDEAAWLTDRALSAP